MSSCVSEVWRSWLIGFYRYVRVFRVQRLDTGGPHPLGPIGGLFKIKMSGLVEHPQVEVVTMCGGYVALLQTEPTDGSFEDAPNHGDVVVMDWRTGTQLFSQVRIVVPPILLLSWTDQHTCCQIGDFLDVCFLDEDHLLIIEFPGVPLGGQARCTLDLRIVSTRLREPGGEPFTLVKLQYPIFVSPANIIADAVAVSPHSDLTSSEDHNLLVIQINIVQSHNFSVYDPQTFVHVMSKTDLITIANFDCETFDFSWAASTVFLGRQGSWTARCNGSQVLLLDRLSSHRLLLDFTQQPVGSPNMDVAQHWNQVKSSSWFPLPDRKKQVVWDMPAGRAYSSQLLDFDKALCVDIARDGLLMFVSVLFIFRGREKLMVFGRR